MEFFSTHFRYILVPIKSIIQNRIVMQPKIIKRPAVHISPDLLYELQELTQEQGQVVIHCVTEAEVYVDWRARVQKTTFLFDLDSDHQSELLHVVNISIAPEWTIIQKGTQRYYSLIFSGLPKSCTAFDLAELNEPFNPFVVRDIQRNGTDVYYLAL